MRSLVRPLDTFSPRVRRALRIEIPATLLVTLFGCLTGPFTGLVLRRELGASAWQLSVLASASAAALLLSLMWSRALDGRHPLPWVVWPAFLARALFLLTPLVHGAWPFVALLVAANLLGSVVGPAHAAVVARVYPPGERGRALGLVRLVGGVPAVALALGAGHLLAQVDYRWLFPTAACAGMAASLWLRRLPVPEAPRAASARDAPMRGLLAALRADARLRRLLGAAFVFGSGVWIQVPATPLLMADWLGVDMAAMGALAAVAALAGLAGNAWWGRVTDRHSPLVALRLVYLVGALGPLLYGLADGPAALAAAVAVEALMNTGLDLVWMLALVELAGPARAGHYVAIGATLAGVRGLAAPLLGAALIERAGLLAVYPVATGLMLGAALLVTLELRRAATSARSASAASTTAAGATPRRQAW